MCPGHTLARRADKTSRLLSGNCAVCEPLLAHDPLWAASPQEVPLTEAEQKDADAKQREADFQAAKIGEVLARLAKHEVPGEPQKDTATPKRRGRPPKTKPQDAAQ